MRTSTATTRIAALLVLCLALGGAAAAEGAGGLLFGLAMPAWNPNFMPDVPEPATKLESMGGFGYGVTRDGFIIGGFGLAFLDYTIYQWENWVAASSTVPSHVAGGVGGVILGTRLIGWPSFHLDLGTRLGLGGMAHSRRISYEYVENYLPVTGWTYRTNGYFIGYAEPYVEAGLGIAPWLHLGATLSYPTIVNLIPGRPLSDVLWYTPSLGISLSFGNFKPY